MKRYLIGMSGATGAILTVRLIQELKERTGAELQLIASPAGIRTLALEEPDISWASVKAMVDVVHDHRDIAAGPASGGYPHDGMIIIPCSISTVGSLAHAIGHNLLTRAADVTLKERRPLIVVPREAPLHAQHLRNLTTLAELGAVILPPMLAFYQRPETLEDMVNHVVGKTLDQLRIEHDLVPPWTGPKGVERPHTM